MLCLQYCLHVQNISLYLGNYCTKTINWLLVLRKIRFSVVFCMPVVADFNEQLQKEVNLSFHLENRKQRSRITL